MMLFRIMEILVMSKHINKRKISLHELIIILNHYLPASEKGLVMIQILSSNSLMIQRIDKNVKSSESSSLNLLSINPSALEKVQDLPKIKILYLNNP